MPLDADKIAEIKNLPQVRTTMKDTAQAVVEGVAENHKAAAVADMPGGGSVADAEAKINELLAALRAAGLMAT